MIINKQLNATPAVKKIQWGMTPSNIIPSNVCLMFSQTSSEWPHKQTQLPCFSSAPSHCHQADFCDPLTPTLTLQSR